MGKRGAPPSSIAILRVKPEHEFSVARRCVAQGSPAYVPLLREFTRRGHPVEKKFLPGFVFVFDVSQWDSLRCTPGVYDFVLEGGSPALAGSQLGLSRFVRELQRRHDKDGYVVLDQRFSAGQSVRVACGSSVGLCQGYSERQRVRVLFDILGGRKVLEYSEQDLVAA